MHISIVELDYHVVVLNTLCRVLHDSEHRVTLFTREYIFRELCKYQDFTRFEWRILPEGKSAKQFIDQHFSEMDRADVVLFSTMASTFAKWASLNFSAVTILRIYNANAYLRPGSSIQLEKWWGGRKDLFHLFREMFDRPYRNQCVRKVDFLTFPDENIRIHLKNMGLLDGYRVLPSLPITIWDEQYLKREPTEGAHIAVPGTIDTRRKDYDSLLLALSLIKDKLKSPMTVSLLGKPKGESEKQLLQRFQSLSNHRLKVECYESRIPQHDFSAAMRMTDLVVAPIRIETRYKIYRELYGFTKPSGSISDLIYYGKPGLVPAAYPVGNALRALTRQYKDANELAQALLDFADGDRPSPDEIKKHLTEFAPRVVLRKIESALQQAISEKDHS